MKRKMIKDQNVKEILRNSIADIEQDFADAIAMFAVVRRENIAEFEMKCISIKHDSNTADFDMSLLNHLKDDYFKEETEYVFVDDSLDRDDAIAIIPPDYYSAERGNTEPKKDERTVSVLDSFVKEAEKLHPKPDEASCPCLVVDDVSDVIGVLFRYSVGNTKVYAYQAMVPMWITKQSSFLVVGRSDKKFEFYSQESIKFGNHFDFLIIDGCICCKKMKTLERQFLFLDIMRRKAAIALEGISSLISGIEHIEEKLEQKDASLIKKLVQIRSSPVLTVDPQELKSRLEAIPEYKDKFIFNQQGLLEIQYKKDINPILKMLNDDLVKSPLTNTTYDSAKKKKLDNK